MLTWLRVALLLALAGLAACLVATLRAGVDPLEHERYSLALRSTTELDSRIDKEVAEIRLGVTTHYDTLVRLWDQMGATHAELEQPPSFIGEGREQLLSKVAAQGELLDEKQALVERFKTEHAVLRNSSRAFPHNADRLLARLRASEEGAELASALQQLEHDVLLYTHLPRASLANDVRCRVAMLSAVPLDRADAPSQPCRVSSVGVPAELQQEVRQLGKHALIVVRRQNTVDELTRKLTTLPVSTASAEVAGSYAGLQEAARERSRLLSGLAFVFALLALGTGAGYIIVRLQTSAAKLRDASDQLESALAALRRERDHEVELANLKSQFVSMTSHEFRTPLSVILSSAELIQEYGDRWGKERRLEHLGRIQEAAGTMSRMLDGVLLVGRAEAGMLEAKPGPVRLGELTSAVLQEVGAMAGSSERVDYVCEAPEGDVWMDEKLLRHVLINLLSNAFKYSPADTKVLFRVCADDAGATFEVRDDGIGIPEEEQATLFEAFHRCSNAEHIPGSGLGMAVIKKSLDAHNGSLEFQSRVGAGTRFLVRVPYLGEAA